MFLTQNLQCQLIGSRTSEAIAMSFEELLVFVAAVIYPGQGVSSQQTYEN
jgi:hypothetical protein